MRTAPWWLALALGFAPAAGTPARANPPQAPQPAPNNPGRTSQPEGTAKETDTRAEAYYHFTMGHVYEQYYEATNRSEYANLAIQAYKKAYELDPTSPVIGERLVEMYYKSQRIRDAVLEAKDILQRDPDNVPVRRLLARIYVRTLGDLSGAAAQRDTVQRAIEQHREILRLEPTDVESALWLARLYRLQNQQDQAADILRALLKRVPDSEPALEQLTQLLLDQGKAAEAIPMLEGATKRAPTAALLELLGDAYSQAKESAKAEQAYQQAVGLDPAGISRRRGLAQSLLAQQKYEAALAQYKKLSELDPDDAENFLRIAQINRELHQLDQAEENILRAKQIAPGNLEVIYTEAKIYAAQGRFEDAIRVLSDAVTAVKGSASPSGQRTLSIFYQQLGLLYREVENFPAAVRTFEEMYRLGDEEARRARALVIDTYRAGRDLPRALDEARKALELYPQDTPLRISYAMLLGEKGETDEAARRLRELLPGNSDAREVYLDLAQVYERGKRYADAEEAARTAEKLAGHPDDNEMVWFMLGAIYERQKKFDLAEEQFKRVLGLNPRNAPVLNYYGYMLADRGVRLDEAASLVERALAEDPQNAAYLDSLGWAYYKQGRLADAEGLLRRAAERDSRDPTIHSHLGDIYNKTGRAALAAAEWERALTEWRRASPAEHEPETVAELEKKLSGLKHRLAQQSPPGDAKPQ